MDPKSIMDDWLAALQPNVRKELSVISKGERILPDEALYHITTVDTKVYWPMMPRRAATSEDNTVPRVTVAGTLLGCIHGYASLSSLYYFKHIKEAKGTDSIYKGGLYINELEFDHCVKPTKQLVYDADVSGECWLVNYDADHIEYKAHTVGKMVLVEQRVLPGSKGASYVNYVDVAVYKEEGISLDKNIRLAKGFWSIVVTNNANNDSTKCEVVKITEEEFNSNKRLLANMLSYSEIKPKGYSSW